MAKNFYQDGNTMDWHNGTGKAVVSGQAVAVGAITGIAQHDIPANADDDWRVCSAEGGS